ncbi:MAG: M23 family metallopeptidase [Bdellovibrionales bacterium]
MRVRYVAGLCAAVMALGVGFVSGPSFSWSPAFKDADLSPVSHGAAPQLVAYNAVLPKAVKDQVSDAMRDAPQMLKKAVFKPYRSVAIGQGDTIAGVLQEAGLSGSEAYYAVKALGAYFDPRKVKSGQKLGLYFAKDDSGTAQFQKMSMPLSPVKDVYIVKDGADGFKAQVEEKELTRREVARFAEIQTSLYGSAARSDIPAPVIAEMIRIYSWGVDFQRDIRRGDKVEVLYESFETEDGAYAKNGDILYARLNVGGRDMPIYRYKMQDGRVDYFEPDGTSIRKTLMKTPIDGARISSGFGMRHHPVLGYNKMHKGMDFAAATGTPIYAAGDGVISFAGRKGGYGNYIQIRHNSKLSTAYAHMHKFKSGMKSGARVKQGDVIGYVGTTGRSTGPHLHYEVLVYGKQVNPRSVDLPTGEILEGNALKRFKAQIKSLDQQYVSLTKGVKYAQVEGKTTVR